MSENMCKAEKHEFVWEKYFNKPFEISLATCSYHSIKLKQTVLVTKVSGPDEIEIGQSATYTIDSYNVWNVSDEDKKRVKWLIEFYNNTKTVTFPKKLIDKEVIQYSNSNYEVLDNKLIINKFPKKCFSEIRVYPYINRATFQVMQTTLIKITNKTINQIPSQCIKEEVILIVGTEQHSATYGNKMMFPAQAIREVRQNYSNQEYVTILIFTDGFNAEELRQVEESAKMHNKNTNFIKINSVTELINYINNGTNNTTRLTLNPKNHLVKIKTIKIFAHGLASILDFGLDGSNRESQQFKISHVSQLKLESFMPHPEIYSYACRTGNGDTRLIASTPGYSYGSDWLEVSKPKESLAQKLANHLDATVYAFLRRSYYRPTWNDGGDKGFIEKYEQIEDDDASELFSMTGWKDIKAGIRGHWDEVLWNDNGAYALPTVDSTPKGLPKEMYIFEKDKEPRSK